MLILKVTLIKKKQTRAPLLRAHVAHKTLASNHEASTIEECVILSLFISYISLGLLVSACIHQDLHSCGVLTFVRGLNERCEAILKYVEREAHHSKDNQ